MVSLFQLLISIVMLETTVGCVCGSHDPIPDCNRMVNVYEHTSTFKLVFFIRAMFSYLMEETKKKAGKTSNIK